MADVTCSHIGAITTIKRAKRRQCEECVKLGSPWVHLRVCQDCGATRCCDDSPNRHATEHARGKCLVYVLAVCRKNATSNQPIT
jgi:hypothetical protein